MTFWIFGDSYAEIDGGGRDTSFAWTEAVAKHFNQPVRNLALGSTSLSYTYDRVESVRNDILPGDVVIVCLTHVIRQWFFRDRPMLSHAWSFDHQEHPYGRDERDAFEKFIMYLDNPRNQDLGLINFLYNLNDLAGKGVKIIVMACFPETEDVYRDMTDRWSNLRFAIGSLVSISYQEIDEADRSRIEKLVRRDPRAGHFLRSTHPVLTNKLIQTIENGYLLNLTTGFTRGIITLDKITDRGFISSEFFYDLSA
jgi:hypothetical protein